MIPEILIILNQISAWCWFFLQRKSVILFCSLLLNTKEIPFLHGFIFVFTPYFIWTTSSKNAKSWGVGKKINTGVGHIEEVVFWRGIQTFCTLWLHSPCVSFLCKVSIALHIYCWLNVSMQIKMAQLKLLCNWRRRIVFYNFNSLLPLLPFVRKTFNRNWFGLI